MSTKSYDGCERVVLDCPTCGCKLRLPLVPGKVLSVSCPKGCPPFDFGCTCYVRRTARIRWAVRCLLAALVLLNLAAPWGLGAVRARRMALEGERLSGEMADLESNTAREKEHLRNSHLQRLAAIDPQGLRDAAAQHYADEWQDRSSHAVRYALTERERTLLGMKALAAQSTASEEELVRGIAVMASPRNSSVRVTRTGDGLRLDVDFDMSELTHGEIGTRTKHHTKEALKKEVDSLIGRVRHDVHSFCKDMGLETIAVGCRHQVRAHINGVYIGDRNKILYKVILPTGELGSLEHNPHLGTYSVSSHFQVEIDGFPEIEITSQP